MGLRSHLILASFLLAIASNAQQFTSISVKEGLADNIVSSIEQDHLGYMWFATLDGLDRFDGYKFTNYSLKGFGLNYDGISYVAEDAAHNLWVRSHGQDVYVFDRENDCLSANYADFTRKVSPDIDTIDDVVVDSDKNVWLVSDDVLYYYDIPNQNTTEYALSSSLVSLASKAGNTFISLSNGEIWQIRPQKTLIKDSTQGRSRRRKLMIDSSNRLWAYSNSVSYYKNGVWYDAPAEVIKPNDNIVYMIDDNKGRLWFGSITNGITTVSYDLSSVSHITNDYRNEFSLCSNHISSFFLSDDSILWVATSKRGVCYSALNRIRLTRISTAISEDVGTIIQDKNGDIIVGYDGKGLWRLSGDYPSHGQLTRCLPGDENVIGSFASKDKGLYFATFASGVYRWDGQTKTRLRVSDHSVRSALSLTRDVLIDRDNNLWMATFSGGVVCIKADGQTVTYTISNSEIASNSTTSMTYSEVENKVFVSTSESLNEIDCKNFTLKKLDDFSQVRSIHYDTNGILWVGTAEGLFYIDRRRDNKAMFISEGDGLSNHCVNAICSDLYGNLWVTTGDGFTNIFVYDDPVAESVVLRCYPYYEQDGIGSGHFARGAIYCDREGNILMGCNGDIVMVRPEKYPPKNATEPIQLTSVSVSDKVIPLDAIASGEPVRMKSYDKLSIEVSAMDFQNRLRLRYESKVDGAPSWNTLATNVMKFNSLPSGRHTVFIRVKGLNPSAAEAIALKVIVSAPLQRSIAAFVLYGLVILTAFLAVWFNFKQKSRERVTKEKMELDEMRMQFFTNVGHDLRTPLTMIITPLSRLIRESKGTPMEEDLKMISKSADVLKDEINQLLDFKKLGRADLSVNPTYGDICRFVSEVSETFSSFFSDGSIKLVTNMPDEHIMMDFDKDKVQRILRNLLSNSFKYSEPGANVTVSVERSGDTALISVADTGRGISDENKERIFERFYQAGASGKYVGSGIGLNIVREYAALHGGTVSVADNAPQGSIFTVTLPITEFTRPETPAADLDTEEMEAEPDRPRILLVEDNELFRLFLYRSLADANTVVEAGDGQAALDQLATRTFDIVISDVMMPVMDGLELCRTIKNDIRYSHIPVILLTAIQNEEVLVRSLKEGADEYISKPFDIEVLLLKIQKILSWSQENRRKWSEESTLRASQIAVSRIDKELMERVTLAVENNMANTEFSIEELTQELGISRSRLYKKLTSITGKSPIEFIRVLRLKKAKQLLEEGETSVSQIAWSVGFSPKQFSKYFKDEYGCLPSEYIHHLTDPNKNKA